MVSPDEEQKKNGAQPRHELLHFYSVHFHTSHNTEKVSKSNNNRLFQCLQVFPIPRLTPILKSLFSNTVIKRPCINRKCKKIREENTFSLCYKKPPLPIPHPPPNSTVDYLDTDSLLSTASSHCGCCFPWILSASWQPCDIHFWGIIQQGQTA